MLREKHAFIMKGCLVPSLVTVVLLGAAAPAAAQGQPISVAGHVQWIAGDKMMLIPDSGAPPIDVDITQVPLDNYRTLTERDRVVVSGVVSPDGRQLIASSISPLGG